MPMKPFEAYVTWHERLWASAHNVAYDITHADSRLKNRLVGAVHEHMPRFLAHAMRIVEEHTAKPRVLIANMQLPVGCNATCPTVCGSGVNAYRAKAGDLSADTLTEVITEFAKLGGREIRVVGVGEPVLSPLLPLMADVARCRDIRVIVCTNGLELPEAARCAYREFSNLHFYVKLWSAQRNKDGTWQQDKLVVPKGKRKYQFSDRSGQEIGFVPEVFHELYDIDPRRVGLRVLVYKDNEESAREILTGSVVEKVPVYIDKFIAQGDGRGHDDLKQLHRRIVATRYFGRFWPNFAALIDVAGRLVPVHEIGRPDGVPVVGELETVWSRVFRDEDLPFFALRWLGQAEEPL